MPAARLIRTVPTPLGDPALPHTLPVQHGDTEVTVGDRRFPAPWPRRFGTVAVSPTADLVVFAGTHALHAVDRFGAVRWEHRHGCWTDTECEAAHTSYTEYADDPDHAVLSSGSAAFSADGRLLWAHVRTFDYEDMEEWLVLDAADGTVLARASTDSVASGSDHVPHPDPAYMGLSIAEGEDRSPVLWGHWDGAALTVQRFPEEILLGVNPAGNHFLTTDLSMTSLSLHRMTDGAVTLRIDAGEDVRWDFQGAFAWDDAAVVGTDEERHWLADLRTGAVDGPIGYPFPVSGTARPAGPGRWYTVSPGRDRLHVWELPNQTCRPD
ncbi:hypothetical protein [Actinoplanes utahensis]|uniref:WD40 repeat domain-containing protein n=1 Tax=Actinoplanes utahensis TaxID=1869 RepID=A0A0A6UGR5_ACTUT|nr:hypothetical protein [Actinoplanes utahensis]KHD73509.1 hypothetical protein MB27_33670 [Actinoplanes utahensis]